MNCIYLKQKLSHTLYCKRLRKEIQLRECVECKYKEYKNQNVKTNIIKNKNIKSSKLERERFSLFTDNKDKCMFCDSNYQLTWHEIFRGKNRENSMKYGLCLRMCLRCHERFQEDKSFNNYWHKLGQKKYMQYYNKTKDDFISIFRRNYL